MLHFCLMENQRKPPRRTKEQTDAGVPIGKAKKEMTYVRNNYEKKKTHKCVATGIVLDAHGKMLKEEHVFAEIDNYKQRKQGGEHTICVDLQHWFSRHSDSKQSRASDTGKLVEESTITPLDEAYDADDVPFTTGETDAQEEFSFCCVEPYEGEELPFPVEEPPQQEMEFYTVEQPYPLGGFQLSLWKNNELPFN